MTDALTREMIEELRGLAEKATPGPWDADFNDGEYGWQPRIAATDGRLLCVVGNAETERQDQWEANAALIVATINALPALLDLATASLAGASATPGQRINGLNDALAFAQGDTSRARVIQPKGGDASAETRVHPDATSPGVTAGASAGDDGRSATGLEHPHPQEGRVSVGDEELCKRLEQHSEWHCDDGTIDRHYRNPDGPEAAARLRSLAGEVSEARAMIAAWESAFGTIEAHIQDRIAMGDEASPTTYLSIMRSSVGLLPRDSRAIYAATQNYANMATASAEAAESEAAALRERLKPFAHAAEYLEAETSGFTDDDPLTITYRNEEDSATDICTILSFGDFRRARTALHGREKDNG